MPVDEFYLKSFTLFFVLLNPFLLSIYLIDLITDLQMDVFSRMLLRGAPDSVRPEPPKSDAALH